MMTFPNNVENLNPCVYNPLDFAFVKYESCCFDTWSWEGPCVLKGLFCLECMSDECVFMWRCLEILMRVEGTKESKYHLHSTAEMMTEFKVLIHEYFGLSWIMKDSPVGLTQMWSLPCLPLIVCAT